MLRENRTITSKHLIALLVGTLGLGTCLDVVKKILPERDWKSVPVRVAPEFPNREYKIRNYSSSDEPEVFYIDIDPFGDLDYVIDYRSGERTGRQPSVIDNAEFHILKRAAE